MKIIVRAWVRDTHFFSQDYTRAATGELTN